ncbi:MAG TPA: FN3 associated domain-containing protein [Candidatus Angelobacter sp.]|nr:FN3 associated domain-containing protein [Candidatus Angelobacter sp.]
MRNFAAHLTILVLFFFAPVFAQTQGDTAKTSDTKTASQGKTTQPHTLTDEQVNAIIHRCNFDPTETDPQKVNKAAACVNQAVLAVRRRQKTSAALESLKTGTPPQFEKLLKQLPPPLIAGGTAPGALVDGSHVGGSNNATPSACNTNSGFTNSTIVGVRRELLAPKEASDVYGRRLGRRYFVYQVRVTNLSKDFQYIVHDISIDLSSVLDPDGVTDPNKLKYLASERDLTMLRGVTEKGQDLDPRNLTLHVLQGVGSVAGGVSGLTDFSDTMGSAVAVFNGAFLQAFVGIAPDHTATQLNRLSDTAFASNSVVDKLHAKVFAIFIPESFFLDKQEQNRFWKNPKSYLEGAPFDQVDVCVDGALITEITPTPNPSLTPAPASDPSTAVSATSVSITDSANDSVIYYTIDGSDPSSSPTRRKYSTPIPISDTVTIRALAESPNHTASQIVTGTYKKP